LGQVFLNLIVNAAQAIPEGNVEANVIRILTYTDADGHVVVQVSDSGCGIAKADLHHLFRPFYTTKGSGVGTGLGLAISHRIVTSMGGEIQVDSELGKGTTFKVLLPASSSTPVAVVPPALDPAKAKRRARVLVVDDEPMIGSLVRRMLSAEHDVVVTLAAAEALRLIRAGETFDAILCDLMMPQMTGMEFLTELRRFAPHLADRLILLTGGAFTPAARAFLDSVPNPRVEKPFDLQHLRALVNDRVR
jgi:CheY-like chemotaxis protein